MSGEIALDEVARVVDEIAAQAIEQVTAEDNSNNDNALQQQQQQYKLRQVIPSSSGEPVLQQQSLDVPTSLPSQSKSPLILQQSSIIAAGDDEKSFSVSLSAQEVPQSSDRNNAASLATTSSPVENNDGTFLLSSSSSSSSEHTCVKPRRRPKCRVSFADDAGKELFTQRECPPSDVPPDLDVQAILKDAYVPPAPLFAGPLGGGMWPMRSESTEKPIGKWAYAEQTQPIDDYAMFAQTIEKQLISAENVFLNNDKLICTIKVKCVKQVLRVFARITFNNWISFDDVDCHLIPMTGLATSQIASVLYQRYVLERELPPVPTSSEPMFAVGNNIMFCFCVVYTDREERWDNHFGRNYVIECVPFDPSTEEALNAPPSDSLSAFGHHVIGHHYARPSPQPGASGTGAVVTEEEKRYNKQLRAMSPDYTYYNESTEFYW